MEDLRYIGHHGRDHYDEYFLLATGEVSEGAVKAKIQAGDIQGTSKVDPDLLADLVAFNEMEVVPMSRGAIVRLLTYG